MCFLLVLTMGTFPKCQHIHILCSEIHAVGESTFPKPGDLCFSEGGDFNAPICEDELNDEEELPYQQFSQERLQQGSKFSLARGQWLRLAVGILALLAVVVLFVNISLGVHYTKLAHSRPTVDDMKEEVNKLQETIDTALETMTEAQKKQSSELSQLEQTKWEFDHQARLNKDYKTQFEMVSFDVEKLRSQIPMTDKGCKHCPPGWILMNAQCFYFSLSDNVGLKTWLDARKFCQLQGGDLAIIDSKDKENSTVTHLRKHQDLSVPLNGFWIGLRDSEKEGTWKWLNGRFLVEGYWDDGEPNNRNDEDCAVVYAKENFFKAWKDKRCGNTFKWICEKAPAL